MATTEDEIRDAIIDYFYQLYVNRSGTFRGRERGDKSVSEIRKLSGYDPAEISRNLEYLEKSEFITHVIEYTPAPGNPDLQLPKHSYEISINGIHKVEGASKYMKNNYNGINISNVGGVVVLGDENIVNQNYQELTTLLDQLSEAIRNENIPDTEKLNAIADIETIQQQIKKPAPNEGILKAAWEGVKKISIDKSLETAGKIMALIDSVSKLLG